MIHRLLKNHVTETTGLRAYALFSDAAIKNMGLEEVSVAMTPMIEEYEHLGQVKIWVQDMQPVWAEKRESTRVPFPEERVALRVSADVRMSPELVWDYLARPEHRAILIGSDRQEAVGRKNGRLAEGSAYQCFHGDKIHVHTILEWRPFERVLTQDVMDLPMKSPLVLSEYRLEPTENGTRVTQSIGRATGALLGRTLVNMKLRSSTEEFQRDIDNFKEYIEADLARREGA